MRQMGVGQCVQNIGMSSCDESRILFAERLDGGIIVHFSDGRSAIFSASLLLSVIDRAEDVPELDSDDA